MNRERGDHAAGEGADTFERWYREHHNRLLAQCARMLHDRAASEDIAQETLLRAWLGRDQMREEDVGAWLTVVARNLCISHIRKQKRAVPTEVLPETPDEAADPAHVVTRLESRRAVRRALRQVGGRHGAALFRREIEGVDYEELGTELGLTLAGTRTVMFRARRMLRERLAAAGEGVGAWVVAVRIRVWQWRSRGRSVFGSVDASVSPALQVGVNAMLAVGMTLSSYAGFLHPMVPTVPVSSSISNTHRAAPSIPTAALGKSHPRGDLSAAALGGRGGLGSGKGGPASFPGANVAANDGGNTHAEVNDKNGKQLWWIEAGRGPNDPAPFPYVYSLEDETVAPICERYPEQCS